MIKIMYNKIKDQFYGEYMASIKDVAKLAHVGPATVSRVLNNSGYVSKDTRERIMDAIAKLDYKPNELARNLFRKKAGIVAILVPDIEHPYFSSFVAYAEKYLQAKGYKVMICNTISDKNSELEYLDMLDRYIVDGIITDVHNMDIDEYNNLDKPIVALERILNDKIPAVCSDHKMGGRLAAERLIKAGCKKILHFREAEDFSAPFQERHSEFNRVMNESGVDVVDIVDDLNRFDVSYFTKQVEKVFENNFDYDGVFGGDLPVICCMKACIRRGYRIPQDIKIIAYDGTYVTDTVEPELTAIVQPIEQLAKETVRILIDRIEGKENHPHLTMLPVSLKEGGSV